MYQQKCDLISNLTLYYYHSRTQEESPDGHGEEEAGKLEDILHQLSPDDENGIETTSPNPSASYNLSDEQNGIFLVSPSPYDQVGVTESSLNDPNYSDSSLFPPTSPIPVTQSSSITPPKSKGPGSVCVYIYICVCGYVCVFVVRLVLLLLPENVK